MVVYYVFMVFFGGQYIICCCFLVCGDRIFLCVRENGFDEMVVKRKNEVDEFYKIVIFGD